MKKRKNPLKIFPFFTNSTDNTMYFCGLEKIQKYQFLLLQRIVPFSIHSMLSTTLYIQNNQKIVISISRNGLLKSCARFVIERSEIRKKQHDFKSVHFECRMVLFYMIWEKSRLQSTFFPQNVEKAIEFYLSLNLNFKNSAEICNDFLKPPYQW